MEKVVLKAHSLPERLRITANEIPVQKSPSISDPCIQAYKDDPLPNKILKAISHVYSFKDITVAQCTERDGQRRYRGKRYIPAVNQLRLQLILQPNNSALAGHPERAKRFDLLDRMYY